MILIVAPADEAEAVIRARRPSHRLGLASPGSAPPAWADGPVQIQAQIQALDLTFNDIAGPRDGLVPPSAEHIDALLAFGRGWRGPAPLLVHCWAGISRSTAAAYALACARAGAGSEVGLALRLRAVAPFATPNPLMVALADARLGRGGAMTAAIAAIGRGAEAGRGRAFDFPAEA